MWKKEKEKEKDEAGGRRKVESRGRTDFPICLVKL
jgi:hypothetical protein